jgi:glycosyltransferase involved in cell wall biosynthesis
MKYQIVVPSRGRPYNVKTILSLMPDAYICVDERERKDYAAVPKKQLLLHPPTTGVSAARNWIIQNTSAPCLIQCDDDLVGVRSNIGSKRFITNADEVMAVIENAMTCCADLDLTTFCFSRTANTTVVRPDERPIVPTQQVFGVWGVMGNARRRLYDETLKSREDLDWTLRTLLEDRIVYADIRFYFDFGSSFSGTGGTSGLVTADDFRRATEIVAKRWGTAVSFKKPGYMKGSGDTVAGKPVVRRSNSLAGGRKA